MKEKVLETSTNVDDTISREEEMKAEAYLYDKRKSTESGYSSDTSGESKHIIDLLTINIDKLQLKDKSPGNRTIEDRNQNPRLHQNGGTCSVTKKSPKYNNNSTVQHIRNNHCFQNISSEQVQRIQPSNVPLTLNSNYTNAPIITQNYLSPNGAYENIPTNYNLYTSPHRSPETVAQNGSYQANIGNSPRMSPDQTNVVSPNCSFERNIPHQSTKYFSDGTQTVQNQAYQTNITNAHSIKPIQTCATNKLYESNIQNQSTKSSENQFYEQNIIKNILDSTDWISENSKLFPLNVSDQRLSPNFFLETETYQPNIPLNIGGDDNNYNIPSISSPVTYESNLTDENSDILNTNLSGLELEILEDMANQLLSTLEDSELKDLQPILNDDIQQREVNLSDDRNHSDEEQSPSSGSSYSNNDSPYQQSIESPGSDNCVFSNRYLNIGSENDLLPVVLPNNNVHERIREIVNNDKNLKLKIWRIYDFLASEDFIERNKYGLNLLQDILQNEENNLLHHIYAAVTNMLKMINPKQINAVFKNSPQVLELARKRQNQLVIDYLDDIFEENNNKMGLF